MGDRKQPTPAPLDQVKPGPPPAPPRTFAMNLAPHGSLSSVSMDGMDISALLRGVVVRSVVGSGTEVELMPRLGSSAELIAALPEAKVQIAVDAREAVIRLKQYVRHGLLCHEGGEKCVCGLDGLLSELLG